MNEENNNQNFTLTQEKSITIFEENILCLMQVELLNQLNTYRM